MAWHINFFSCATLFSLCCVSVASWGKITKALPWLIAASLALSLGAKAIGPLGLFGLFLYWLSVYLQTNTSFSKSARGAWGVTQLLLALAVVSEIVFGPSHAVFASPLHIQPDAVAFSPSYHVEAVAMLGITTATSQQPWCHRFGPPRARHLRDAWWPTAVVIGALIPLAVGTGFIRFAPSLGLQLPYFFLHNLFLAVLPEEVLFRGLMPHVLQQMLPSRWCSEKWAMVIGAVIFGLAHLSGGPAYAGFSLIAGLGYGIATLRAQSINGGIIAHIAVNMVHFNLFTYPALQR